MPLLCWYIRDACSPTTGWNDAWALVELDTPIPLRVGTNFFGAERNQCSWLSKLIRAKLDPEIKGYDRSLKHHNVLGTSLFCCLQGPMCSMFTHPIFKRLKRLYMITYAESTAAMQASVGPVARNIFLATCLFFYNRKQASCLTSSGSLPPRIL